MEYIIIEKGLLELLELKVKKLSNLIENSSLFNHIQNSPGEKWVENTVLAESLGISTRTLQNYRQRGVLGYSVIGRKIYYRSEDVEKLISEKNILS